MIGVECHSGVESWRWWRAGLVESEHLEEGSHFLWMRQAAMCGDVAVQHIGPLRFGGKRFGARRDAEPFEEDALRASWQRRRRDGRLAREGFEIHMGGQIGLARAVQRIDGFVVLATAWNVSPRERQSP